jgi:hypothetical protein
MSACLDSVLIQCEYISPFIPLFFSFESNRNLKGSEWTAQSVCRYCCQNVSMFRKRSESISIYLTLYPAFIILRIQSKPKSKWVNVAIPLSVLLHKCQHVSTASWINFNRFSPSSRFLSYSKQLEILMLVSVLRSRSVVILTFISACLDSVLNRLQFISSFIPLFFSFVSNRNLQESGFPQQSARSHCYENISLSRQRPESMWIYISPFIPLFFLFESNRNLKGSEWTIAVGP